MIIDSITSDLKEAQLARDKIRVSTLRLLLSEIHNMQIQKGGDLADGDIFAVIRGEVKKRKEAAALFRQGGREELAQKEELELKILEGYLPAQLTNDQLTKIVEDTINEVGASSQADMGKVMGVVMGKVAGRVDGGTVSALVQEKLS